MLSLVTGACGFVGQAVVRRLLADGDTVRALVLPGDPHRADLPASDHLEVVEGDVTQPATLIAPMAGVERVFHVAALVHGAHSWARFEAVNVGGTQNVARAAQAAGVQRFVHVSTSDVFGIPRRGEPIDEDTIYDPWHEPYPDTKIAAEQWLWGFSRQTGLAVSAIYPCWVYGPGDQAFFPSLAEAIGSGVMFFWHRHTKLYWTYIDNLADAIVLASTHPDAPGNGYLVHDGDDGPTLQEVCARIAGVIGRRPPTLHVPYAVAYAVAAVSQFLWRVLPLPGAPLLLTNDVKSFGFQWRISNAKLRTELGWAPTISTTAGMDLALAYLRERRR